MVVCKCKYQNSVKYLTVLNWSLVHNLKGISNMKQLSFDSILELEGTKIAPIFTVF